MTGRGAAQMGDACPPHPQYGNVVFTQTFQGTPGKQDSMSTGTAQLQSLADDEALSDALMAMNETGTEPVLVGFDRHGNPFLAYGWAPGGDGWATGFVSDDTHSKEFDYSDGTRQCGECSAFDRRPTERLAFPVMIVVTGSVQS